MAAARIAAAVLLSSVLGASAQQEQSKARLTIQVTDATGAVVPDAQVEVAAGAGGEKALVKTDQSGNALFELAPGAYQISVKSPGFYFKGKPIEVANLHSQSVHAVVVPGGCPVPEPCRVVLEAGAQLKPEQISLYAPIPLLTLQTLPVASVRLRRAKR